jgi:hypothetical protein
LLIAYTYCRLSKKKLTYWKYRGTWLWPPGGNDIASVTEHLECSWFLPLRLPLFCNAHVWRWCECLDKQTWLCMLNISEDRIISIAESWWYVGT